MPTLPARAPLRALADILYAAAAVGPGAWDRGPSPDRAGGATSGSNLIDDLQELFALLKQREVPYLLVGGVALLRYVDGRNTQDIDLVLSVESLSRIPEITLIDHNRDFGRGRFKSVPVDLRLSENPLFKLVRENYATVHAFAEIDVPTATVEGLILLKLYALPSLYRQGEGQRIGLYESDIFMLCQRYRPDVAPLFDALRAHLDEGAMHELMNILGDIQKRIDRIDRAKGGA